jgi:hypothetical protein
MLDGAMSYSVVYFLIHMDLSLDANEISLVCSISQNSMQQILIKQKIVFAITFFKSVLSERLFS